MIPVLRQNKALFDRLGISAWHQAGYDGSLGLTMTFERPYIYDIIKGQVELLWADQYPVKLLKDNYDQDHAYWTAVTHLQVAPGRKIVSVIDRYEQTTDGILSGFIVDTLLPWMLKNKPDTGFKSIQTHSDGFDEVYGQVMPFCTLCNSAGNKSINDYSFLMRDNAWLGVAAVNDNDPTVFIPEGYTSISDFVDFSGIAPIYVPATSGLVAEFDGTSCAAPFLSGMIALINHYFIKHIGRSLSFKEMYAFIKHYCVDITSTGIGKDATTGWGMLVLPDPYSINPSDWVIETSNPPSENIGDIIMDNTFNTWSQEAGEWAVTNGILKGDENGDYQLSANCTREQMIVFLYRLYKLMNQ